MAEVLALAGALPNLVLLVARTEEAMAARVAGIVAAVATAEAAVVDIEEVEAEVCCYVFCNGLRVFDTRLCTVPCDIYFHYIQ